MRLFLPNINYLTFSLIDGAAGLHTYGLICLPLILTVTFKLTWISSVQPHITTPPLQAGAHTPNTQEHKPSPALPCFHLWENLSLQQGAHYPFLLWLHPKKIQMEMITTLLKKWLHVKTCQHENKNPPFHTDKLFVWFLPVNHSKVYHSKREKGEELGVEDEQICHALGCGKKTLRNCWFLTTLTVTSTPTGLIQAASVESCTLAQTGHKTPFLRTMFFAICVFGSQYFSPFIFSNGSWLECNKKETARNVLWHFIAKKWKILFLSVFCVHPCK